MKCPVDGCDYAFVMAGDDISSEPFLTHSILLHIIKDHKLVEVKA